MKTYFRKFQFLLIIFSFFSFQNTAIASACNKDIRQQIKFSSGSYCWSFDGKATSFYGNFGAGQKISVRASGFDYLNQKSWIALDLSATDRVNFVRSSSSDRYGNSSGQLDFVTPHSGYYEFSIYPCYMWGSNVKITICAVS
jgi:hypothetical protein